MQAQIGTYLMPFRDTQTRIYSKFYILKLELEWRVRFLKTIKYHLILLDLRVM